MLPISTPGYAVDPTTGEVHSRYADHAKGLPRTRTAHGVTLMLAGNRADPCRECFPPPKPVRRAPVRRTPTRKPEAGQ